MLLILQLDKELRRKQSNDSQTPIKSERKTGGEFGPPPAEVPGKSRVLNPGHCRQPQLGLAICFAKSGPLETTLEGTKIRYPSTVSFFFQKVPLNKAVEVFTSVHCTTAAKTSHDIVQLTFGFPPCVVRWQTSLELMEFYHSQGKCYTVYFIH